jgi:hypothetical protein
VCDHFVVLAFIDLPAGYKSHVGAYLYSTFYIHQNIEQPRIIESFNLELRASEVMNNGGKN